MSCSHEHHGHGHGDGHGHDHSNDDSHLQLDASPSDLLFGSIDRPHLTALNASSSTEPQSIIKPWHERNEEGSYVESEPGDPQLLIRIPFEGSCKLKSLLLKTGPESSTPESVVLFINQDPPLDFTSDLEARSEMQPSVSNKAAPAQKIEQVAVSRDVVEYPLRTTRFGSTRDVTLFVPGSVGGRQTRIYYVGFRGEGFAFQREGPANLIYEATPQLKDHKKIPGTDAAMDKLGQ